MWFPFLELNEGDIRMMTTCKTLLYHLSYENVGKVSIKRIGLTAYSSYSVSDVITAWLTPYLYYHEMVVMQSSACSCHSPWVYKSHQAARVHHSVLLSLAKCAIQTISLITAQHRNYFKSTKQVHLKSFFLSFRSK